jgi:hypothetical protein
MDETSKSKISFSLELYSRDHIKRLSLPDGSRDSFVVEGTLGGLDDLEMVEDILLEVNGVTGKIRIDITRKDLEMALSRVKRSRKRGRVDED